VRQVGYLQGLNRDALSTKHKIPFNIVLYTPKPPKWYCPFQVVLHALI